MYPFYVCTSLKMKKIKICIFCILFSQVIIGIIVSSTITEKVQVRYFQLLFDRVSLNGSSPLGCSHPLWIDSFSFVFDILALCPKSLVEDLLSPRIYLAK